jgi:hypothetical protein
MHGAHLFWGSTQQKVHSFHEFYVAQKDLFFKRVQVKRELAERMTKAIFDQFAMKNVCIKQELFIHF